MKTLLIKAKIAPSFKFANGYISGVGRSTMFLLQALAKEKDIPFKIKLYGSGFRTISFDYYKLPFEHFSFPLSEKIGCERTMIEPYFRAKCVKYDLLHIPHNVDRIYKEEKFIVTLHDTIEYDNALKSGNKQIVQGWREMALRSRGIITCSQASKNEIIDKLSVSPDKIDVIYWGSPVDKFYELNRDKLAMKLKQLKMEFPYFLTVSCSHPRKNIRFLLNAFSLFKKQDQTGHRLIVLWKNPPMDIQQKYRLDIESGNIIFMNYVSDDDLLALYNGATATLYPSLAEGFGFPILESFACATPIVTCRNTSLPEIGKDAAIYTSETDVDEMVEKLYMLAEGNYDINDFLSKSKKVLSQFSWSNTAKQYIKCYSKYLDLI